MVERGKAAVLVEPGRVEVEEVEVRAPDDGELLVRNFVGAICGSDVHRIRAESPFFRDMRDHEYPCPPGYPGHEGLGEVVDGNGTGFTTGDLVLTVPNHAYMRSFATYQTIGEKFVLPVSAEAPHNRTLMAQQLGTVVFALKRFWPRPEPGASAAVVGVGSAGLLFLQLLKHLGFGTVIAVDLEAHRLDVARAHGADATVHVPHEDVATVVDAVTGSAGVELAVEAAGTDAARAHAMRMTGVHGRLGFYGMPEDYELTVPYASLFGRQTQLITAVGGAQLEPDLVSFRHALDLIGGGAIAVDEHISHSFDLENIGEAVDLAHHRFDKVLKVGLTYDS